MNTRQAPPPYGLNAAEADQLVRFAAMLCHLETQSIEIEDEAPDLDDPDEWLQELDEPFGPFGQAITAFRVPCVATTAREIVDLGRRVHQAIEHRAITDTGDSGTLTAAEAERLIRLAGLVCHFTAQDYYFDDFIALDDQEDADGEHDETWLLGLPDALRDAVTVLERGYPGGSPVTARDLIVFGRRADNAVTHADRAVMEALAAEAGHRDQARRQSSASPTATS